MLPLREDIELDPNSFGPDLGSTWDHSPEFANLSPTSDANKCPVKGAFVLIDGVNAIDSTQTPIQTDAQGKATIEVPIGTHQISLEKTEHVFLNDGSIEVTMQADATEPLEFIDLTTKRAVGTILGGTESEKPIGTASNNVGIAKFLLFPVTANVEAVLNPVEEKFHLLSPPMMFTGCRSVLQSDSDGFEWVVCRRAFANAIHHW